MNVALLLSCSSFEGFFTGIQGQTRASYLSSYRGDWCWYYGKGLVDNGIKPILYIPSVHEEGLYETDAGISVRFLPLQKWYRLLEPVWVKKLSRTNRYTLYLDERLNTLAFMSALRAGMAEDGIDLLYIQEYWSGRFDHLVNRLALPITAADHGGVSDRVLKWFKRPAFAKAPLVYCQTLDECDIVRRFGGDPVFQPNGCDLREFHPDPNTHRTKTILTVARLTNRQKRTSDLIDALALLPADWSLDIVGTGPDLGMLQSRAQDAGVSDRVRFHGFVDRQTVRTMLQRCGVFAMPSSNEAVAIAALEAMGSGASVVLSQIRSFETMIENGVNGQLVPVGDTRALAKAIETGWIDRATFGTKATQTVKERFDTQRLYKSLAHSLRTLAA